MARPYHNAPPSSAPRSELPKDIVKVEFARRLQKAMLAKGWNQTDLAREADKHMADGEIRRDNVSQYIRGVVLPGPKRVDALAKALGVPKEDLLWTKGLPQAGVNTPDLDARDLGDGNAWLRINMAVPWDVAVAVLKLLKT